MAADERPRTAQASLWRFALALYARSGVAEALVALQDSAGCNVNLVLFALWLGAARGGRLDADGLAAARIAIAPVDETIVRPMRELRQRLKSATDPGLQLIRRRVLLLELAAEQKALDRLAGSAAEFGITQDADRLALASANLAVCLGDLAISPEAVVVRRQLADLMRHAAEPEAGLTLWGGRATVR